MTRGLLLALLAVVGVAAIGMALQPLLFGSSDPRIAASPAVAVPPSLLPSPPDGGPPLSTDLRAVVADVVGPVEVFSAALGRWQPAEPGDELGADAVLRTRQRAHVTLAIGDRITVKVSQGSQFRLGELSSRMSQVQLEGGQVTADVQGRDETELLVRVLGSDAEARSREATFAVMRAGDRMVTVASTRGEVRLSAAGGDVTLAGGEQSVVVPGESPTGPMAIPGAIFLKLRKGQSRKLTSRSTVVEGATTPGSVVEINGVEGTAPAGHFAVRVPLREGDNDIRVSSRDVLGRTTKEDIRGVNVDSVPPEMRGRVEW